jgi:hypothetical protein
MSERERERMRERERENERENERDPFLPRRLGQRSLFCCIAIN